MKRVLLRDRATFKARDVIQAILEQPAPGSGISYADMRKRDRLMDTLERARNQAHVDFEDADYDVLLGLLNSFQFGIAKRELRQILDDVANAKSPEDTMQLKLIEDAG